MSEPVRVLHVVGRMNLGGVECWLMNILRRIDPTRFRFIFCPLSGEAGFFDEEIRSLGGTIHPCPISRGLRAFSKGFHSVLRESRCDVVHSHMLFFTGHILKLAARAKIPIRISHAHTTKDGAGNSVRRRLYRWTMRRQIHRYGTHGLGCSPAAADYLFSTDWRNRKACRIVFCGVDPTVFRGPGDRSKLCELLGIPTDARIVGHVGSFRHAKNHDLLLHIFAAMLKLDPRIHLLLIGDGPLLAETKALADRLGVSEHVTFAGVRTDVPILMRELFDVFLFPSRHEGLPVSVLESQCAGVRCLASDAVPSEVVVVDELVSFESVSSSPEVWARRALGTLDQPAYGKTEAWKAVSDSPFNLEAGVRILSDVYSGLDTARLGWDS